MSWVEGGTNPMNTVPGSLQILSAASIGVFGPVTWAAGLFAIATAVATLWAGRPGDGPRWWPQC